MLDCIVILRIVHVDTARRCLGGTAQLESLLYHIGLRFFSYQFQYELLTHSLYLVTGA